MTIGKPADDRRCDGLEEREEGAKGAAEEDDIVTIGDRASKGVFVGVEGSKDTSE